MEFSENLIRLRKSRGWSQEELGYKLDVSRQTVSKWEMGDTTPEMAKLIKMGDIFGISIDSLLTDIDASPSEGRYSGSLSGTYEYKSKLSVRGLPLIHINIGRGMRKARGIIAIGNIAVGIISLGILSAGVLSAGILSLGLLAAGALTAGALSTGGVAIGYIAIGGMASGYLAIGGVARGIYAIGGVSQARDIAMGGVANGYIAIGESVRGTIEFITKENFSDLDPVEIGNAIDRSLPETPTWIRNIFTGNDPMSL